jgi:fatty acid amide hydrolase
MPLGDPVTVDVAQLRVAYYTDDGTFQVAPAVRRAVTEAATILRKSGARVTAWTPPDAEHAQDLFFGVLSADGGRGVNQTLGRDKRDPRIATLALFAQRSRPTIALLRGLLHMLGQRGLAASLRTFGHHDTLHYWQIVEAQMHYQQRFKHELDAADGGPFDVVLCPACSLPAFIHGASRDLVTAGAYANLYNVLGYPAGIVPVTRVRTDEEVGRQPSHDIIEQVARKVEQGSAGLPIGVQVVARPWREHVALAVMGTIEQSVRGHADYPGAAPLSELLLSV